MALRTFVAAVAALAGLVLPAHADARTRDCADRALVPGADLRRCDLRPLPLATLDLTGADMSRANLAHMYLSGGADGPQTKFGSVRLSRADLTGARLDDVVLEGADLSRAKLRGAGLEDAILGGADLSRADLRDAFFFFTGVAGASFRRADLRGAYLAVDASYLDRPPADFRGANLAGAYVRLADLTGARFRGANLAGVVWEDTVCPDGTNSDANDGTCVGHLID
jgi:uncharacterized protein YjbI with pentapeptide repeats